MHDRNRFAGSIRFCVIFSIVLVMISCQDAGSSSLGLNDSWLPQFDDSDAASIYDAENGLFDSDQPISAAKQPFPIITDDSEFIASSVFPGAEGFGTNTPAGRLGGVCTVTNLDDSGDGSLRSCVEAVGSKTVVFDVAGTVYFKDSLVLNEPFISILGQSAPEPGITLTLDPAIDGAVVEIQSHDILIQHLRVRAGASDGPSCCRDAVSIGSPVEGQVYNVVLDHNSLSWGTDEVIDIWFDSHDVTLSRNIISEGLHHSTNSKGPAGRGLLVGAYAQSISIHHNLFAHNYGRNPKIKSMGVTDVVNNVIYHWVSRGTEITTYKGNSYVNLVKNVYIAHGDDKLQPSAVNWFDVSLDSPTAYDLKVYFEGNFGYWRTSNADPEWSLAGTDWSTPYEPSMTWHTDDRHEAPQVTEIAVEQLETVIRNDVGATLPVQDSVDIRLLDELDGRSGYMPDCVVGCELNAHGWPAAVSE